MRVLTGAAGCLAGAGYILVLGNCFLEIAAASTVHCVHDHFTISWARAHPRDSEGSTPFDDSVYLDRSPFRTLFTAPRDSSRFFYLIANRAHFSHLLIRRGNGQRELCESCFRFDVRSRHFFSPP